MHLSAHVNYDGPGPHIGARIVRLPLSQTSNNISHSDSQAARQATSKMATTANAWWSQSAETGGASKTSPISHSARTEWITIRPD